MNSTYASAVINPPIIQIREEGIQPTEDRSTVNEDMSIEIEKQPLTEEIIKEASIINENKKEESNNSEQVSYEEETRQTRNKPKKKKARKEFIGQLRKNSESSEEEGIKSDNMEEPTRKISGATTSNLDADLPNKNKKEILEMETGIIFSEPDFY